MSREHYFLVSRCGARPGFDIGGHFEDIGGHFECPGNGIQMSGRMRWTQRMRASTPRPADDSERVVRNDRSARRAAGGTVTGTVRIRVMSRQRKPKHPGGRPAQFGARPNLIAVRVDDRMRDELEIHAEAAGLPLALYCMLRLAEMHDLALVEQASGEHQEQLPLGAA